MEGRIEGIVKNCCQNLKALQTVTFLLISHTCFRFPFVCMNFFDFSKQKNHDWFQPRKIYFPKTVLKGPGSN